MTAPVALSMAPGRGRRGATMADLGKVRILVVEDEPLIAHHFVNILKRTGRYDVDCEMDGDRAAERIPAENPDLVLLDLGLPGKDGIDIIREVREKYSNPIVIVTGKSELEVHALGLNLGASDFLKKPVGDDVLLAHVECRLRERGRTTGQGAEVAPVKPATAEATRQPGPVLEIDCAQRKAFLDGKDLELWESELGLLELLARRPGETVSKKELSEHLKGAGPADESRVVEMAIHRLRGKLGKAGKDLLQTVRNEGYRLSPFVVVRVTGK